MGLDVEFKARPFGELSADEFAALREAFIDAMPEELIDERWRYPDLVWDDDEPKPTIQASSLHRYYSPGYERGHWPAIRAMGDWLAIHLGERAELRYGHDAADEWDALTPWVDARAANDAHWEQWENRPYYIRVAG